MTTKINVSYNYGGQSLKFSKIFFLSFTPFYNLIIDDSFSDYENIIELRTTPYQTTNIYYVTKDNMFEVEVRKIWKMPIRADVVDEILFRYDKTNWTRIDNTDIDSLKELMNRNE